MKRFTLIFSLLMVVCFGVKAQEVYVTDLNELSNEKTYLIESARCVLINSANVTTGLATTNGSSVGTVAKSIDDPNQQFKIEKDGENYYLYSVGAGKYVTTDGAWSDTKGTALAITDASSQFPNYPWLLCVGNQGLNSQDPGRVASGIVINTYVTPDAGNCFRFIDIEATKALDIVEITYNFVHEGKTVHTETVNGVIGQAYPDYPAMPWGVSAAAKPSANVTAAETVNIEVTFTALPFEYADSYTNIEHWYYVNVRDDGPTYMQYDSSKEYIPATASSKPEEDRDSYTWAFVGNPFGFQIVNLAAGETMVLSAPSAPTANQDAAQLPRMVAKESATGNTTWTIVAPTHNNVIAANGFYIQHPTAPAYAINRQDYNGAKTLCYWDRRDTGSTFQVVERPMGATAELEALIAEIEAMNIVAGTNIGDYTEASVNALNEAIATAKTLETATADDVAALQAALDALATVSPSADKVYAFNVYYNGFGYYLYSKIDGSTSIYTQGASSADTKALWQFVEAEGGYNIKNVHTNLFISKSVTMTDVASEYGLFVVTKYNTENGVKGTADEGKVYIKFAGDTEQCIHSYNRATAISWLGTGLGNQVGLEEVSEFSHTLTVTDAGWATLVLGFNATIPAEVTAYTIASEETGYVTLAEATGVLQANVPVLVEAAAGDYVFAYTTDAATVTESGLEGTLYNKDITANAYVLGIPEGETEACFAKATTEGKDEGTFTNNANKAYFVPTNAQANIASYSFRFGEGTTGIENVVVENGVKAIFDLTGRRVENPSNGIYIINGVKVLVK